jgi:hypothetical protein
VLAASRFPATGVAATPGFSAVGGCSRGYTPSSPPGLGPNPGVRRQEGRRRHIQPRYTIFKSVICSLQFSICNFESSLQPQFMFLLKGYNAVIEPVSLITTGTPSTVDGICLRISLGFFSTEMIIAVFPSSFPTPTATTPSIFIHPDSFFLLISSVF